MPDDGETQDYEVGYRRPPRHSRFKPGQSGNPRGRPNRSKNINTLMQEELDLLLVDLRQSVHRLFEKLGTRVRRFVPALVFSDVF